ncbi:hypothetical protein ILUMI_22949 [Ignelater luminosus]|uniref:Uncharacterized protein n=1 Tax=Ignelater luminosus TaxID=2038154 RepID=A0A8K0CFL1_IGNLU|nr:hypothetical protein ILUMI_22949 [Ignelater luminosus]
MILRLFILGYQKLRPEFLNCIIGPNLANQLANMSDCAKFVEMAQLPEFYQDVKDRLHKAYEQNVRQYILRKRPLSFSVGDTV